MAILIICGQILVGKFKHLNLFKCVKIYCTALAFSKKQCSLEGRGGLIVISCHAAPLTIHVKTKKERKKENVLFFGTLKLEKEF